MPRRAKKGKRDLNEPEIVSHLEALGARVDLIPPGPGYDLIVYYRSNQYTMEVKNPDTSWTLTPNEIKAKQEIEARGCRYHVVTSKEEARAVILNTKTKSTL